MKIRILGCGGSFGSPLAWNRNGNIDIKNKKNIRTRSSLLLNLNNQNILIVFSLAILHSLNFFFYKLKFR